eukprot:COSAG03_NODE_19687_length_332_cov_0.562232_1_plen_36_part_01
MTHTTRSTDSTLTDPPVTKIRTRILDIALLLTRVRS